MASDNQVRSALKLINDIGLDIDGDRLLMLSQQCGCLVCRQHILVELIVDIENRGYRIHKLEPPCPPKSDTSS
jgi:hypothetical protein